MDVERTGSFLQRDFWGQKILSKTKIDSHFDGISAVNAALAQGEPKISNRAEVDIDDQYFVVLRVLVADTESSVRIHENISSLIDSISNKGIFLDLPYCKRNFLRQ